MNAMQIERHFSKFVQYKTIRNFYLVYYFNKDLKMYIIEKYFAQNKKFIDVKQFFKQKEFFEHLNSI
jgi:hypothetical protein